MNIEPHGADRNLLYFLLSILLGTSSVVLIVLALAGAPMHADAGYTLSMARAIARGAIPFQDLAVSHTTVAVYLYAGLASFYPGQTIPIAHALAVMLAAEVGCSVAVLVIARQLGASREEALLASSVSLLSMLVSEGLYLELEPFVALFSLLGTYFTFLFLRRRSRYLLLLSGLCCGLAIVFKQYGLITPGVLGLILLAPRGSLDSWISRAKDALIVGVVSLTVWGIYAFALWAHSGVDVSIIAAAFFGQWYRKFPENFPIYLKYVVSLHPCATLVPLLLLRPGLPYFRSIAALFLLSLLPGFVRHYGHYYIQAIPFLSIALVAIPRDGGPLRSYPASIRRWLIPFTLLPLILWSLNFIYNFDTHARADQAQFVRKVNSIIAPGSRVMVIDSFSIFYLGQFESPAPTTLGYGFPENLPHDRFLELARQADFILLNVAWAKMFWLLPAPYEEMIGVIEENHVLLGDIDGRSIYRLDAGTLTS